LSWFFTSVASGKEGELCKKHHHNTTSANILKEFLKVRKQQNQVKGGSPAAGRAAPKSDVVAVYVSGRRYSHHHHAAAEASTQQASPSPKRARGGRDPPEFPPGAEEQAEFPVPVQHIEPEESDDTSPPETPLHHSPGMAPARSPSADLPPFPTQPQHDASPLGGRGAERRCGSTATVEYLDEKGLRNFLLARQEGDGNSEGEVGFLQVGSRPPVLVLWISISISISISI